MSAAGWTWSNATLVLLIPALALAAAEGEGRVTLEGGWRLTPNATFLASARAAGVGPFTPSTGGPAFSASFGYAVTQEVEVGIDLFAGAEQLKMEGGPPLGSVSYGGAVGIRFWPSLGLPEAFAPFLGFLTGPTLLDVTGGNLSSRSETLTEGYILSGGASVRLVERWGLLLEYRFLLARGSVPGIGSINGGGHWFGLGFSYFFPPDPREGALHP